MRGRSFHFPVWDVLLPLAPGRGGQQLLVSLPKDADTVGLNEISQTSKVELSHLPLDRESVALNIRPPFLNVNKRSCTEEHVVYAAPLCFLTLII